MENRNETERVVDAFIERLADKKQKHTGVVLMTINKEGIVESDVLFNDTADAIAMTLHLSRQIANAVSPEKEEGKNQ